MIAISYRREDSLPVAGRLYDRLQQKFGRRNVFMDFDSIPPGTDFREQIKNTIERSDLLVAVIGPHWFGSRSDGSRRIDEPTDFVRLEIEYALQRGIPIIPLLLDETPMPGGEALPPALQALAFRNALPLDSGMDFHSHVNRLISGIAPLARSGPKGKAGLVPSLFPLSHKPAVRIAGITTVILTAMVIWLIARLNSDSNRTDVAGQKKAVAPVPRDAPSRPDSSSPPSTPTPAMNDPVAHFSKELARCDKYRATWTGFDDEVAPEETRGTIWILTRATNKVLTKLRAGFAGVSAVRKALFSKDGRYLAYEEGNGSLGTTVRLFRIGDDGATEEIKLGDDDNSPFEMVNKPLDMLAEKMQLPPGGSFGHSYCSPASISSDPLILFFDLEVDYYATGSGLYHKDIHKPTRVSYDVKTRTFEIVDTVPKT
jgi:TIR domain-containing protein